MNTLHGLLLPSDQAKHAGLRDRLPTPPTDKEKYAYFGPQRRWIVFVQFAGFSSIAASVTMFMVRTGWTWFVLGPPLALTILASICSLLTSSRGRRFDIAYYESVVANWSASANYSVDVFLPSAGESLNLLRNTYRYVSQLHWLGPLTIYVLDDSGRPDVETLAREFGFTYLSRPDRGRMKKAGNLAFGYEHSSGDLIVVFDADFCPRSDFLDSTVPFMRDSVIGIVQTPQYFDVDPSQNWLQRGAGATQEFFYRWVQPARDRSDGAICVGTNAVYRRKALAKAGGFAQIGHSEDVHTGVNLLRVGYLTRYVPVVVAKGACPDAINAFVVQQYRWCTGSMSLLFSRTFHHTPLTTRQRLCFWTGFLYYITTAINVFAMWLPPLIVGFIYPHKMHPSNYVLVIVAVLVRMSLIPVLTSERGTWAGLARIQMLYSFAHATALIHSVRGRSVSWVATGAARGTGLSRQIRMLTVGWLVSCQALLWLAILRDVPRYGISNYWPMVVFASINLYLVAPIVGGLTPRTLAARRAVRRSVMLRATAPDGGQ
ncbi:MAG TPA: cellulose synthase catalytic subunit [Acidothermaceae bacterium]